jgi:hypothetical protein
MNIRIAGIVLTLMLCLMGCKLGGDGPRLIVTPQIIARTGMNLSIGDVAGRADGIQRLTIYLDEIAAAGYLKEVRMVFDRVWGPFLLPFLPILRRKGFKLLAILSSGACPGGQEDGVQLEKDKAWISRFLPEAKDILVGVQCANEQWGFGGNFAPNEYAAWHNELTPLIRDLTPGVPIVEGDVDQRPLTHNWWRNVVASGVRDVDALSLHITGHDKEHDLLDVMNLVRQKCPEHAGRLWITEGNAGQMEFLNGKGFNVERAFPYTWATTETGLARRPGGGILPG